ncbi:hypothetical protein IG631_13659 [Alternaria alternata]|nr:hypothetical protein IG631_13659 [Alternaria alternata]
MLMCFFKAISHATNESEGKEQGWSTGTSSILQDAFTRLCLSTAPIVVCARIEVASGVLVYHMGRHVYSRPDGCRPVPGC